ncbi:MAG: hypothetical protein JWP91_4356 [Fibrobacteres bacterium]|nr:hypothetical protein [Fibrobacterota bacterium]
MKRVHASLSALACAGLSVLLPAVARAGLLDLDSVRTMVMDPNGVTPRDISLLPVSGRPDPFRLSRVENILREPFLLEGVTAEIMSRTAPDSGRPAMPISPDSLWPLLDVDPSRSSYGNPQGSQPAAASADSAVHAPGPTDGFDLERALGDIREGLREHTADLTPAEASFLYREAPGLFLQEEEDTSRTAVEGELRRLEDDARSHRIMELARKLRWQGLVRASAGAWRLENWLIQSLRSGSESRAIARLKKAAGKEFPVHVGTKGSERQTVGQGIWIDPGGDDEYVFSGPGKPGSFTLVVDAGGNDIYLSKDSLQQSAGNMGVGAIADLSGSDRYLGSNFAYASAEFGFSSLFDAAGHDYYEGRCASLGFAFFGIGVLQDEAGNDVYSASLMSQASASTKGAGVLLDRAGDDRYLARPTFQDDLRYTDHYIQMVQGFATGFSPDFGGGIGLLRDTRGNDIYLADIFGQGTGYWYALGMLIDEAGDDRYEAHQYAQGAGVHIAVGALLDFGGNDHRASKGVSQGCGHDLGFGYLYDKGGHDNYLATDMSQGAGSANGLGILQDTEGDDMYSSLNPDMALGHADMRRDRGSFGLFLDRAGYDRYTRRKSEGAAWRVYNGKSKGNGFGLDN